MHLRSDQARSCQLQGGAGDNKGMAERGLFRYAPIAAKAWNPKPSVRRRQINAYYSERAAENWPTTEGDSVFWNC